MNILKIVDLIIDKLMEDFGDTFKFLGSGLAYSIFSIKPESGKLSGITLENLQEIVNNFLNEKGIKSEEKEGELGLVLLDGKAEIEFLIRESGFLIMQNTAHSKKLLKVQ